MSLKIIFIDDLKKLNENVFQLPIDILPWPHYYKNVK